MSINAVHIVRLVLERQPVEMTAEQERIHFQVFPSLRSREFMRLLKLGTERTVQPGEVLISDGTDVEELTLVMTGELAVHVGDGRVATLTAGHFAGELSLIRRTTARGTVRGSDAEAGCVSWTRQQLRALEAKHTTLDQALRAAIGRDLAMKVVEER